MSLVIPLRDDVLSYTTDVSLENRTYRLGLEYAARQDRWLFSLWLPRSPTQLIPVTLGQVMASAYGARPLLLGVVGDSRPPGDFVVRGTRDPGRYSWSRAECALVYYTAAELA